MPTGAVSVGRAAHITAAAGGGPRFNPDLTREQRRHIDNGIWACANCADLIDKDQGRFSVDELRHFKATAEREAAENLGKPPQTLGATRLQAARDCVRRAARVPDMLAAFVEHILAQPNSSIALINPGDENCRGRARANRRHADSIRQLKGDIDDALSVLSDPTLSNQVAQIFASELLLREQIQKTQVPRQDLICALSDWQALEETVRQIRAHT